MELEDDKIFCPICIESRSSDDVDAMETDYYHNFVGHLFDILDRYCETPDLRKILLSILEIFLPKRSFNIRDDYQFHKILRIVYKLMKSDLYNQNEFVFIARIMSGLSIRSLQPIPLRSAWDAWKWMLDYGQQVSFSNLIDQNSQQGVPENLSKFHIGQAIIVKSYLALINHIALDYLSEIMFTPQRQKESIQSKYYESSQVRCVKFTQELLIPNCECYLLRETTHSSLELQVISEVFGALRECFINAVRRKDEQFLEWIRQKDVIAIVHRIFSKNPSTDYRLNLYNFIKTYVQHYIEKEYGELNELRNFMIDTTEMETVANQIEKLDGASKHANIYTFYLLLNWVSIKIRSRYFVASRVRRVLTRRSEDLDMVRQSIKRSRLFMRIFAFVAASALSNSTDGNEVISFLENEWQEMLREKTLSVFRYIYCYEPLVFEWAHANHNFLALVNCDTISYLIERGVKRNHLVSTLTILLEYPDLRRVFHRYIKRFATTLFEKIIPMGTNGIDRTIMDDFSNWLPALLFETLLRYMNNTDKRARFGKRLNGLLTSINWLINDAQRMHFNPYFGEDFIVDFVKFMEMTYLSATDNEMEYQLLVVSNEFMAQLIQSNNPCVLKLIQYIDFTLIGYMYHALDNYKIGDRLGAAIARVLVAYDNLDYPLEHRIERTLFPMSSSAYEWMMSTNPDLHAMSIILVDKLYPAGSDSSLSNHRNLSNSAKACIVTGFMHMLCANLAMIDNQSIRPKILRILKFEDFRFHPLFNFLVEMSSSLRDADDFQDIFESPSSSPDLSFASADTGLFEEEQVSVTRILEQLNEDEGYRSASLVQVPRNIFLNRLIDEETLEEDSEALEWGHEA